MPRIDIDEVLREKAPRFAKYIPRFVRNWLRRTIHEEALNDILAAGWNRPPQEFIHVAFERMRIAYRIDGLERLDPAERYLFVANHPFGGLDGMMIADALIERFGDARVVVNDLLMHVEPLQPIWLPVNKHGRQTAAYARRYDEAFAGDLPILTFPAGLCSRRRDGVVSDTPWRLNFIKRAHASGRKIVPLYVEGRRTARHQTQRRDALASRRDVPPGRKPLPYRGGRSDSARRPAGDAAAAGRHRSRGGLPTQRETAMHEIKPIIDPLPREELLRELTPDRKVRDTKRAGNEIYIFTAAECPALMREVGRLREIAFRAAGGGTGEEADIDGEDRAEGGYHQLIVWDPAAQEIVGGYRFIVCTSSRQPHLSTEHYFHFSDLFRRRYLPHTIELGRSFIQPAYQARSNTKSIYALDNLWDGLGALIVLNPKAKYLFGKVTMYSSYQTVARNTLIYFLHKYFPDRDRLVTGRHPIDLGLDDPYYERIFTGENYVENYHILIQRIREFNENIPPLINSYMNLSPTMRVFDTVENPDFGGVEETGILLAIKDIYLEKRERYTRWDGWRANLRARRLAFAERIRSHLEAVK